MTQQDTSSLSFCLAGWLNVCLSVCYHCVEEQRNLRNKHWEAVAGQSEENSALWRNIYRGTCVCGCSLQLRMDKWMLLARILRNGMGWIVSEKFVKIEGVEQGAEDIWDLVQLLLLFNTRVPLVLDISRLLLIDKGLLNDNKCIGGSCVGILYGKRWMEMFSPEINKFRWRRRALCEFLSFLRLVLSPYQISHPIQTSTNSAPSRFWVKGRDETKR